MKILVIRFSSIGDIVLTTPVVRCLKTQLPAAEIHFCTKLQFKTIVENNPYISKTIYYQHSLSATIEALKAEKYDLIIDLHHNLRSLLIKLRLGVESRSFKKLNFKKWLLVKWKINLLNHSHVVDRYLDTVAHLGIVNDQQGLDYFIAPQDEINITDFGPAYSKGYEVYAIGGQHYTKKLPLFKMIELCQQIAAPLVLLGGKEDVDNANAIIAACKEKNIRHTCGQYTLSQSASVIRQAQKVFSHDTGLMHIASAFKKEIIAIWGNTVPALGFAPYQTPYISIENKTLPCRPCSKIGFNACPKGHFKCMTTLDFTQIQ